MMNHKTQGRTYAFKFLYQIVFSDDILPENYHEKLENFDISSSERDPEDLPLNPQGKSFGKDLISGALPILEEFKTQLPSFLKSGNIVSFYIKRG